MSAIISYLPLEDIYFTLPLITCGVAPGVNRSTIVFMLTDVQFCPYVTFQPCPAVIFLLSSSLVAAALLEPLTIVEYPVFASISRHLLSTVAS